MSEPIRIAFIGTGLIVAGKHWPALSMLRDDFRVVALANRTTAKAETLADIIDKATGARPPVYADYREMLEREKLDAVSLALPPLMNPEVSEAALAASCHVIAEKPVAASLADGERMVRLAAATDRILMIAENYRYQPCYRRAAELIADGVIGRLRLARWSLFSLIAPDNPYYGTPWRQQPVHPGGYISDGGVHHMAVLRMLVGEAEAVIAQVAAVRPDLPPADSVSASIEFTNGVLGAYANTWALPGPETGLQIVGTDGALSIKGGKVELWQGESMVREWAEPSPVSGLDVMYQDFARSIRTGQPPRSTPAEALADLRLIVAMLRSSETGKAVRLAEVA